MLQNNFGTLPRWYWYVIYHDDCVLLTSDTGRCLIYLWKEDEGTGYGWGGIDRSIWRKYFFATRVADRLYSTKVIEIDWDDAYEWVCSDTPRGVPSCT